MALSRCFLAFFFMPLALGLKADTTPTAATATPSPIPFIMNSVPSFNRLNPSQADVPSDLPRLVKLVLGDNPASCIQAINQLAQMGPSALRATPFIKQVLTRGNQDARKAARAALWAILNPVDASPYFFEMDRRPDREKANLQGPVRKMTYVDLDNGRKQETTYNSLGNIDLDMFFNMQGWETHRWTYTLDPVARRLAQVRQKRDGVVTDRREATFDEFGNRLTETDYGSELSPLAAQINRRFSYNGPNLLTRYEEQAGTASDSMVFEFSRDRAGKVVERRVRLKPMGPEEITLMEFDSHGNTTAKKECVDLPAMDSSVEAGPFKDQSPRRLLKYRWEYSYDKLDQKTGQVLYWGDEVIAERTSVFQYDQWRNVAKEERRDSDGNLIYEANFTWDQWHNRTSLDDYDHVGTKSRGSKSNFAYDAQGNWTQRENWGSGQRVIEAQRSFEYETPAQAAVATSAQEVSPQPTVQPTAAPTPVKKKGKHHKAAEE